MANTEQKVVVELIEAVTNAIAAAGSRGISSGEVYAMLMPAGCTLAQWQSLEEMLVRVGAVTKRNHLLVATVLP